MGSHAGYVYYARSFPAPKPLLCIEGYGFSSGVAPYEGYALPLEKAESRLKKLAADSLPALKLRMRGHPAQPVDAREVGPGRIAFLKERSYPYNLAFSRIRSEMPGGRLCVAKKVRRFWR